MLAVQVHQQVFPLFPPQALKQSHNCLGHLLCTPTPPQHPPPSLVALLLAAVPSPPPLQLLPLIPSLIHSSTPIHTIHLNTRYLRMQLLRQLMQNLPPLEQKMNPKHQAQTARLRLLPPMAILKATQTLLMPTAHNSTAATQTLRRATPIHMTHSSMAMIRATMAMHSTHRLARLGMVQCRGQTQVGRPQMLRQASLGPLQVPPKRSPRVKAMANRPSPCRLLSK